MLPTIAAVRRLAKGRDLDLWIQVDGGVTEDTAVQCVEAGANVLVAGSAVFGADDPAAAATRIRAAAERAARGQPPAVTQPEQRRAGGDAAAPSSWPRNGLGTYEPQSGGRLRRARLPTASVAGEGWHAYAGGPHAEVVALARRPESGRAAATAVITLEPCSHTGRTGACTAALLTAGVRRVVYAVSDPNPVAAGGAEVLRAAGRRGGGRPAARPRPRASTRPGCTRSAAGARS